MIVARLIDGVQNLRIIGSSFVGRASFRLEIVTPSRGDGILPFVRQRNKSYDINLGVTVRLLGDNPSRARF